MVINNILEMNSQSNGNSNEDNRVVFSWIEGGNEDEIREWLENGGDVGILDEFSSIPLHLASMNGHIGIVEILLQYNSTINQVDDNLQTSLHLAAMKGHFDAVQILLNYQADPNVYDSEDQSPLDWATLLEHDAVADILAPITS